MVRSLLDRTLKDPDSLKQFKMKGLKPKIWSDNPSAPWFAGWLACFEYNAKNSYGGYAGVSPGGIVIRMGPDPFIIHQLNSDEARDWC